MLVSVEDCKAEAIDLMEKIGLSRSYIDAFRDQNIVFCFNRPYLPHVVEDPLFLSKIREIESSYNCVVYAVCFNRFTFGACYSLLIVSRYDEEWFYPSRGSFFYLPSYVLNMSHEECSEFGHVDIFSSDGLISRIS